VAAYVAKPPHGSPLNRADPLAGKLAGAWPLADGSGLRAQDAAGRSDGTLTNGPLWASTPYGKGVTFDGSNDRIATGLTPASAAFSVAALVRLNSAVASSVYDVVTSRTGANGFELGFQTFSGTFFFFQVGGSGGIGTAAATGVWYYLLGTATAAGVTALHVNGLVNATGSGTWAAGGTLQVGGQAGGGSNAPVTVAGVWYWAGRCLTAKDARALAADPFRVHRRRRVPVPLRAAAATGNRRRRVICGASA
jgi:hypothetical protein